MAVGDHVTFDAKVQYLLLGSGKLRKVRKIYRFHNPQPVVSLILFIVDSLWGFSLAARIIFASDGMTSHLARPFLSVAWVLPQGWPLRVAFNVVGLVRDRILACLFSINA